MSSTPCSGVLTKTLSRKGRVVITATKSEFENNDTIFGQFFVEAFKNKAADTDKNSEVSMLEAYLYAAQRVESWYKEQGRLATEHPLLEDSGDATGVARPSPANGEGLMAAKVSLHATTTATASTSSTSPELKALDAERQRLEGAIQDLKYRKATIPEADYGKQMETLLNSAGPDEPEAECCKEEVMSSFSWWSLSGSAGSCSRTVTPARREPRPPDR